MLFATPKWKAVKTARQKNKIQQRGGIKHRIEKHQADANKLKRMLKGGPGIKEPIPPGRVLAKNKEGQEGDETTDS